MPGWTPAPCCNPWWNAKASARQSSLDMFDAYPRFFHRGPIIPRETLRGVGKNGAQLEIPFQTGGLSMNDEPKKSGSLRDKFRDLGENLAQALRSIWGSQERKELQKEIEEGLAAVAESVKKETESFKQRSTGQRRKSDIEG